jgi:hypothetical protein
MNSREEDNREPCAGEPRFGPFGLFNLECFLHLSPPRFVATHQRPIGVAWIVRHTRAAEATMRGAWLLFLIESVRLLATIATARQMSAWSLHVRQIGTSLGQLLFV